MFGTLAGGVALDRWRASVPSALQFCAVACGVSFVLLMFALQMPTLGGFIPMFALGEVALFSINAVSNAAVMWSVPLRLRSLSMSIVTIAIHVFGDVPAPPIVGFFQDALNRSRGPDPENWRWSLRLVTLTLAAAMVLFFVAMRAAVRSEARGGGNEQRGGGGEEAGDENREAATTPLLQEAE